MRKPAANVERASRLASAVRLLLTLVAAVAAWAVLGYLTTLPLGTLYGWSGHPAIPAAPLHVYIGVYCVVLPVVCLGSGWYLSGRIVALFGGRAGADAAR